jgi:hypothetical protein
MKMAKREAWYFLVDGIGQLVDSHIVIPPVSKSTPTRWHLRETLNLVWKRTGKSDELYVVVPSFKLRMLKGRRWKYGMNLH